MTRPSAMVLPGAHIEHLLDRVATHLEQVGRGHDPHGHLLAIERLARAARAEWTPSLQTTIPRRR
jgi:hypothetical protein